MKRFLLISLCLLLNGGSFAQIKEFFLTCNPTDFEYIYDNYEQDIYIPGTLELNGTVWNNVSIRIRGDGSRALPKKSLKLRFNDGAYIDGRTSLNINAEYEDETYVQQYLAARLMQESGQACFDTEHIRIYLNGSFLGLYLLIEPVNDRFFLTRGLDPDGATYKATLDGSCMSVFDQPQYHWEQKSGPDVNMADLQLLIDQLNETPQADYYDFTDETFNRAEMVNIITMHILLSHGSTYYHNYYMHHEPAADKWMMLPWDMDKTLKYYGAQFPYHRSSNVWMPDNPFHEKAIQDPNLLGEIRNRMAVLQSTIFNLNYVEPIIDSIENVIQASVAEDQTDDVTDLTNWQEEVDFYKGQFSGRLYHAPTQIDQNPRSFTIDRVGVAEPGSSVEVHWTPSSSPINRPIDYRFLFADHLYLEDSADISVAGITDTSFSFQAPTEEGLYFYKVQAHDGFTYVNGFDTYNPLVVTSNIPELVINEINYHSSDTHVSGDWVEIHNPLTYAVDLEGWYLKDDQNDHSFELPEGAEIGPGQFVILATDSASFNFWNDVNAEVYGGITFGFGNSGDHLRLFHPSGVLVDEVFYSDTTPWPWQADGYGPTLELMSPELDNSQPQNWASWEDRLGTPGAPNYSEMAIVENEALIGLEVYPNPIGNEVLTLTLNSTKDLLVEIGIYDSAGRRVFVESQCILSGKNRLRISPNFISDGIYQIRVSSEYESVTKKIIHINNHR